MAADTLPITRWVVRQQRRGLVGWAIALAAVTAIYVGFWPAMEGGEELEALIAGLPEGFVTALGYDRIGSAAGYLESTVFGLLGPALLLVFGIGAGARLLAGEEEAGTLELEITGPVSRRQVVLERFAALVADLALLCGVVGLVAVGLVVGLDMDVAVGNVVVTTLQLWVFVVAMAGLAYAAGAATGRRTVGLAVGAGVAVAGFMANAIAPLLEGGRWLEAVSPFSWYLGAEPLDTGFDPVGTLLLGTLAVVGLVVAVVSFDRRDLGV